MIDGGWSERVGIDGADERNNLGDWIKRVDGAKEAMGRGWDKQVESRWTWACTLT